MPNQDAKVFAFLNLTKKRVPKISWEFFLNKALSKKYSLSLVICDSLVSQRLNKLHRKKNKPANILSFPLVNDEGEIFIDIELAQKEALMRDVSLGFQLEYLFVHGLAHLKGYKHGKAMDSFEEEIHSKK